MTVAIETPFHLKILILISERHPIHRPVATRAPDALVYMDAVIEVNVIGEIVHAGPLD